MTKWNTRRNKSYHVEVGQDKRTKGKGPKRRHKTHLFTHTQGSYIITKLYDHMSFAIADSGGLVFLLSSMLWLLRSSRLPFHGGSSAMKDLMAMSPIELCVPRSLSLSALYLAATLHWLPSAAEGSFSDGVWARHWCTSRAECHQESFYHYSFFKDQYYLVLL